MRVQFLPQKKVKNLSKIFIFGQAPYIFAPERTARAKALARLFILITFILRYAVMNYSSTPLKRGAFLGAI
jgi:hypothetical protein